MVYYRGYAYRKVSVCRSSGKGGAIRDIQGSKLSIVTFRKVHNILLMKDIISIVWA